MSISKVPSPLKYSIATFLLCASALATGVFIYPMGLAIFNATVIPMLFAAIASVSAIVALSSAIYLVKSAVSAINNKEQESTYNILEEELNGNDVSTKTPEKAPVTFGTAILQAPPASIPTPLTLPSPTAAPPQSPLPASVLFTPPPSPPLPSQSVSVPPPPFPTEGLKNWKPPKDNDTGRKSLGDTSPKNSSPTEPKNRNKDFQGELEEKLKKIREKSSKSGHLQNSTGESNAEIKDNKDNAKHKTQEKYVERIEKQQEERNKVEDQRDYDFIRSIILEIPVLDTNIKHTDIKKGGNSGQSSGYGSDLEEDQHIQSPQSKNTTLPRQSPTRFTPVTKIDNVDPVNSEAKSSSFWRKLLKKPKKKAEQKTPECISK